MTDAGDGEGGKQIAQNHKKTVRTKIIHTSRHVSKHVKNRFKICSYIKINELQITIYNTKHRKNTKMTFPKIHNLYYIPKTITYIIYILREVLN